MTLMEPIKITEPVILVVEGKDESGFFRAFIDHLGLRHIQVLDIGGKTMLGENLKMLVISPDFHKVTSLGITRDADTDYAGAFASVCASLRAANLPEPASPLQPTGSNPTVVVMILPRLNENGMLEDICLEAVDSDPATSCVNEYFECIETQGIRLPNEFSKAKVHAFLASRQRPDLRLGEAALAGYWPFDDSAFEQLETMLNLIAF